MKNRMILLAIGCLVLISVTSCTSSDNITKVIYTSVEKYDCWEKADNIYLFHYRDTLDFDYSQLGVIEIQTGENMSNNDIRNLLKYSAWENCGNGIIELPFHSPNLYDSNQNNNELVKEEIPKNFNCIVVKINQNSKFFRKYGIKEDKTFINKALLLQKKVQKDEDSGFTKFMKSVFSTIGLVTILLLILSLKFYIDNHIDDHTKYIENHK
jgi:hypothetical protein